MDRISRSVGFLQTFMGQKIKNRDRGHIRAWLFAVVVFVVLCGIYSGLSRAQVVISVQGLESGGAYDEVRAFLKDVVIPKYADEEPDLVNVEAVRRDTLDALYAKGFYSANVAAGQTGDRIDLDIRAGEVYKIRQVQVAGFQIDPSLMDLHRGDILDAQKVLDVQSRLYKTILEENCFYTLEVSHEVVLDTVHHTGDIRFSVQSGAPVVFGKTEFSGAESIDRSYLEHFIKYKDGECWQQDKVEQTRSALLGNGLLSLVQIQLPETAPKSNQAVDVVIRIKERAPRSVKLGASLYTDEGAGVLARWSHRNFWGSGEVLSFDFSANQLRQSVGMEVSKPYFMRDDQNLTFNLRLKNEDSDAYLETGLDSSLSVDRQVSEHLNVSVGVAADLTRLKDKNTEISETYGLVSTPSALTYDNRDNVLDPHRGWLGHLSVEPFVDLFGQSSPFIKTRLGGSTYFDLGSTSFDPVLAIRGSVGSILGSSTDDIPASKRFFAGGGNSIRGFGYQQVGPFVDGDPAGGRSVIEASAEMRVKFTDTIGGVVFIDGGNVYDAMIPNFENGLYWGAGAGVRYYTDFAPIRFDVAVPLNNKENLDQNFQIYISIGQAF